MIQPVPGAQLTALHLATALTRIAHAGMKAARGAKLDQGTVVVDAAAWTEYRRATILAMRGLFEPLPEQGQPRG